MEVRGNWWLVPGGGVEPPRAEARRILSPPPIFLSATKPNTYNALAILGVCSVRSGEDLRRSISHVLVTFFLLAFSALTEQILLELRQGGGRRSTPAAKIWR
jgi:hypothetical protein